MLQNRRIFIVEDNPSNRAIVRMLLERFGARVYVDSWGQTSLPRLRQFAPVDLVLLDLMLPGNMSGYKIYEEIRRDPSFAQVPIVAVSAADASVAIPRTQELGFSGFISKPIDFNLFPQQVARLIEGEKIWFTSEKI